MEVSNSLWALIGFLPLFKRDPSVQAIILKLRILVAIKELGKVFCFFSTAHSSTIFWNVPHRLQRKVKVQ